MERKNAIPYAEDDGRNGNEAKMQQKSSQNDGEKRALKAKEKSITTKLMKKDWKQRYANDELKTLNDGRKMQKMMIKKRKWRRREMKNEYTNYNN